MEVESEYISIPETARRAGIAPKTIYNQRATPYSESRARTCGSAQDHQLASF
jgi:hypothetical protein